MSKSNGFLPLRRGLWEHVRDGRMSVTEGLAFVYICSQADTRSGIWKGCARSLSGELGIPGRTARDVLEKMEHGDYIRRFAVPGRHSCYPILIHKFEITQGEHNGEHLNALESKSPVDLSYFSREQDVEPGVEPGAAQRTIDTRHRTRKQNPAASRPADPRYQPFFDFAYRSYELKHGQRPNWNGKDYKNLTALLGKNQTLALAELERRWNHYSASTERFTVNQGDSLAHFCSHFDSFIDGPILAPPNGAKGGNRADAITARNIAGNGLPN